jgi:Putative multidrug resistance efflux transporter
MEVLFALAGELLFLSIPTPSPLSWFGITIVILGMLLHSFVSSITPKKMERYYKQSEKAN